MVGGWLVGVLAAAARAWEAGGGRLSLSDAQLAFIERKRQAAKLRCQRKEAKRAVAAQPGSEGRPSPKRATKDAVVCTVNTTGWSTMASFLESPDVEHHGVILAQELHLTDQQVPAAVKHARRRGWSALIAPATGTEAEGTSGGVGVFARCELGLVKSPEAATYPAGRVLEAGRSVAGHVPWGRGRRHHDGLDAPAA